MVGCEQFGSPSHILVLKELLDLVHNFAFSGVVFCNLRYTNDNAQLCNPKYSKTKIQARKSFYSKTNDIVSPGFKPAMNTPRPMHVMVVMFVIVI